ASLETNAAQPQQDNPIAREQRTRTPTKHRVLAYSAFVVLIAAVAVYVVHQRASPRAPPQSAAQAPVSAVLPASVSEESESWMRLGVMDVVAGRLRSSGVPSVPSENVVALLQVPGANRDANVRDALGASLLVTPHVQRQGDNWQVGLDADDKGQRYAVEAGARDPIAAARAATEKLLVALGREPAPTSAETTPEMLLIRRIDAAVLADDPAAARALIASASTETQQSPELRLRLAKLDFRAGKLDAARERLFALLDAAPENTAPVLRASILNGIGAVALRSGDTQKAAQSFDAAVGLLQTHSEPEQLGQAYLGRAAAAAADRRFDVVMADYARARTAFRLANDALALIRVSANEGFLDYDLGRPAQALPQFAAATQGFRHWGALNEAILTTIGEIGCYLALLDNRAAMEAADAAEVLAQRIENPATLASLALARSRALAAVGRLREARQTLDRLRSTSGDADTIAAAGVLLARLDLEDNAGAAADLAERGVSVLDSPGDSRLRAEAWLIGIRAALRTADPARALKAVAALDDWSTHTNEPRASLLAQLAHAEYALRFGDGDDWRRAFDLAGEKAERQAVPYEIAAVAASYADALFAHGDVARAQVEVGRASRWADRDFTCAVLEARLYAVLGRDEARQAALARARSLAGERRIPDSVLEVPIASAR
ncbi:MAG TPA: tetratricopeptide repeat protein, partial [Rudaea sp.]